ncbi:MAG: amino acid ABC transporter permease [Chloroflexi bacterium]|nr:amino acid ABC transporter permease [Chloroflexota bacterium]
MLPTAVIEQLPLMVEGFFLTIRLAIAAGVVSLVLGVSVALLRVMPVRPLQAVGVAYVELFRNTPQLILLFFFYFGLPQAGVSLDGYVCGLLGLSMYAAAFVAEAVRAGIQAVARGQVDASRSLGLGYVATMRHIVLPQALVMVLPPLGNTFISLVKGTALVTTIGVADLMHSAELVESRTFATFPTFTLAALFYLVLIVPLAAGVSTLERQRARSR